VSVSLVCSCVSCPAHPASDRKPVSCGFYPSSSTTDLQWALIEPLLPTPGNTRGRGGRPEKHPRRVVLDAIFYVVRGGIAWAALPVGFPPFKTVYGLFRRWAAAGVWTRVHDALRDQARIRAGRAPLPTAAIIDSASVRGADTVPAASRGYDAGKRVNGGHVQPGLPGVRDRPVRGERCEVPRDAAALHRQEPAGRAPGLQPDTRQVHDQAMVGEADAATCYRSGQGLSVSNLTGRADDITTWRPASAPGPRCPRWMGSTSASGRRPVRAAIARVA
jgi:transposase